MDLIGILIIPGLIGVALLIAFVRSRNERQAQEAEDRRLKAIADRRNVLVAKYGDEVAVDAIMRGDIWQGMSQDQLIDSMGIPVDTSTRVFKAKKVETFKYGQLGRNRYATRVTVENGIVVGWQLL